MKLRSWTIYCATLGNHRGPRKMHQRATVCPPWSKNYKKKNEAWLTVDVIIQVFTDQLICTWNSLMAPNQLLKQTEAKVRVYVRI